MSNEQAEALELARPIVEADLHAAIDHCDADWEGMSRTALEAIDRALATPSPAPSDTLEGQLERAETAQLNLYRQAERDREARRWAEEAFDLIAPFVAKFAAAVPHYAGGKPRFEGTSHFFHDPVPGSYPALATACTAPTGNGSPPDGPTISDLRLLAAAFEQARQLRIPEAPMTDTLEQREATRQIPDGCPTCGALPCDWSADGHDGTKTVAALLAERTKDHEEINQKADFIDKTLNQLAEADQVIQELRASISNTPERREAIKAAVNRARHEWICTHGVNGMGVDDAITDAILATTPAPREMEADLVEAVRKALGPFAQAADARRRKDVTGAVCFKQEHLLNARATLAKLDRLSGEG